jgi:hypothetical protein
LKNFTYSADICLIMFFSKRAVTSGKFSLNGRGTFLPLDLSGSDSTLQYHRTLCATEANSLHFLIKNLS